MTNEVTTVDPIASELATIKFEMRDPDSDYHRSPARRARYIELLDARESGKAPPAANSLQAEKFQILKLMADSGSTYWIGPEAEGGGTVMQKRYREILAIESGEHGPTPAGDGWRKPAADARKALDPVLVADWDHGGQFETRLRRAQDVAGMIVSSLDGRAAQMDFVSAFEGLSKPTQSAVLREIAMPESAHTVPATEADIALFQRIDGADQTMALWGKDAQRRVGIALDKIMRIEKSLTANQRDELAYWFWHQTPRERQLLAWALGN
jgi:hypothetical protein